MKLIKQLQGIDGSIGDIGLPGAPGRGGLPGNPGAAGEPGTGGEPGLPGTDGFNGMGGQKGTSGTFKHCFHRCASRSLRIEIRRSAPFSRARKIQIGFKGVRKKLHFISS